MQLPTGTPTTVFRIFLSSGDDLLELRNMVDRLVQDAINAVLMHKNPPVRFEVDRWERTAPHRLRPGESANSEFVARAVAADLVLSLVLDELGNGTREELEAALDEDGVELSVVWCDRRDDWPDTPVGRWLGPLKDRLFIDRAGRPDTRGPTVAIVRLLLDAALTAIKQGQDQEMLRERR